MGYRKRVIIVDDSSLIRGKLKELINSLNTCEILAEAANGIEAIQQISSLKPDIVILDIKMPEMTGIQVLESLQGALKDTSVIILSNYATSPYQAKCRALGASYCLDKTKDFEQLKTILM